MASAKERAGFIDAPEMRDKKNILELPTVQEVRFIVKTPELKKNSLILSRNAV